ncbi:MAG: HlyD family efflux transporter periplasmic adaptor subunit, partial [Candidatus Vogelbacteria bacterium]
VYSNISSLQTIENTIDDTNENTPGKVEDAQRAIQSAQNAVTKKQEALADVQKELTKYSVYATFGGTIASVGDAQKGDTVSSNTVLATLITKAKIAEITLNEVDAAKVKIGQKATITFDALEDLTVTGQVLEMDTIGTTNQGVVDYGAKISLDTTDERIKPGMTLSAEIITAAKQDVIVVSTTAIKKQGDSYYVLIANDDIKNVTASVATALNLDDIKSQTVEIGLANDTMTEIVSGLSEGDLVVTTTKTTNSSTGTSSTSKSTTQTGPSTSEMQMRQMEQMLR